MARETASKYLIGLGIYFIIIAVIFSLVGTFKTTYGLDDGNYESSGGYDTTTGTYQCLDIRFNNEDTYASIKADLSASKLMKYGYIYDNETCIFYEGLTWNDAGSFLWFDWTASCEGNLNYTYYDGGTTNYTDSNNGRLLSNGFWSANTASISDLSLVNDNRTLCQLMGFEWGSSGQLQTEVSTDTGYSVWAFFGDIITFDVSFSTSSGLVNALLNLFIIYLPLLGIIINAFIVIFGD